MGDSLKTDSCFDQSQMFLFLNSWHTSSVKDFHLQKGKDRHCLQPTVLEPQGSNTGLIKVGMLIAYVLLWTTGVKELGCEESLAFRLLAV